MPRERPDAEALFVAHLPAIDRIIAALCRRSGFRGDDADDFASWAKARLIDDDFAPLRKFRGESSIESYLAVVLATQLGEYRVAEWGRWRPSAAARRAGPVGVRLEMLVHRDGLPLTQAVQMVRQAIPTELTDRELLALAATLGRRPPVRPVQAGADALSSVEGIAAADAAIVESEDMAERRRAWTSLARAVRGLPAEDQLMVRLSFWEGSSIAQVARALGLEQKPLYRRIERILGALRTCLERDGISRDTLQGLLRRGSE